MASDPVQEFKVKQRELWALGNFGDVAVFTAQTAGHLVRFAGIHAGQTVLDVATGTGVVAVTAARLGAQATGLDLTPELLVQARNNETVAGLKGMIWKEGDAENLPFPNSSFDAVLSQFGHMFAPRPDIALKEMLRVLKPGGRLAFATWPPEQLVGLSFALTAKYIPPPAGMPSPVLWGDENQVRQRLGESVKDLFFERGVMGIPALSPEHFITWQFSKVGPRVRVMETLQKEPAKLGAYLKEDIELVSAYMADNVVRQEYLLTRAIKI
jgi:ubiquinone/menaquinone biosynthesis C-methylase UbiE